MSITCMISFFSKHIDSSTANSSSSKFPATFTLFKDKLDYVTLVMYLNNSAKSATWAISKIIMAKVESNESIIDSNRVHKELKYLSF